MRKTAFIISLVFLSVLILPFVSAVMITIPSPENKTYNQHSPLIDLNVSYNETTNWSAYSQNGGSNITFKNIKYQENANQTSCSGVWDTTGNPCSNTYDGGWASYGLTMGSAGIGNVFFNYTKPSDFLNATWEVKDGTGQANLTIPITCLNQSVLQFWATIKWQDYAKWYCWNGSIWRLLRSGGIHSIHEEGIWWNTTLNTTITATEGQNNITVFANNSAGSMNSTTVYFKYYDYGNLTAETPDGDQDWNYSQEAGTDELFNLIISSNGTSNSSVNFTIWGEGVNFTMNATNISVNSSGNASVEVNISSNASLTAGTYSLNLSYNQTETGTVKNITITAYISVSVGDVDIVETSWAIAKATTDIITRTFTIQNKGNYNLTGCNMSFTNTLGSTATFNYSAFTQTNTTNHSVKMTVSGGSAGTDNTARVNIICVATTTGGTDSDQLIGSLSLIVVEGGGGGSFEPPTVSGGFEVYPSNRIVGVGYPEYLIQPPFVVNVYNGNVSQKFHMTFSSEINPYCDLLEYPEETISPNGYCKFVFECKAPDGTVEGHVLIKTHGGGESSIPITLIGGEGLWEQFNAFFILLISNPIEALMMNFVLLGFLIPAYLIFITLALIVVVILMLMKD